MAHFSCFKSFKSLLTEKAGRETTAIILPAKGYAYIEIAANFCK